MFFDLLVKRLFSQAYHPRAMSDDPHCQSFRLIIIQIIKIQRKHNLFLTLFSTTSNSLWPGGCKDRAPCRVATDGRTAPSFLYAKMEAEVLGYQMGPKSSRESERLKRCYSLQFSDLFLTTPGAENVKQLQIILSLS